MLSYAQIKYVVNNINSLFTSVDFNHGDYCNIIHSFQWQFLCSVPITAITTTVGTIPLEDSTVTTTMTTITTTITTRHIGKQDFRDTYIRVMYLFDFFIIYNF